MAVIYSDYSRARIGHFFGLSGWQAATLAVSVVPVFVAVNAAAWAAAGLFAAGWVLVVVVVVTPVRGRSVTNWAVASAGYAIARAAGWTRFTPAAVLGAAGDLAGRRDRVVADGVDRLFHDRAIEFADHHAIALGDHHVAIVEEDDPAGVLQHARDIRGHKGLAVA